VALTHPHPFGEQNFRINLIKGQIAKEMVRALLETSGYHVYSFGYENLPTSLRHDVKSRKSIPATDSNNRLRSTPDLLGYDEEKQETYFIEVKFSSATSSKKARLSVKSMLLYQKYWKDAIIVTVIPTEHIFYAQRVESLRLDGLTQYKTHNFDLGTDFMPIEHLFPKVQTSDITSFTSILEKFELIPAGVDDDDSDSHR